MNEENATARQGEAERATPGEPTGRDVASCCGPAMDEMMEKCPCGSFVKKHRLAFFGMFLLMLLMLLISQVGGILGIIAFSRTL